MKKKTEAKKQAIIQAATQIFQELGFEKTSMSKICSVVGGSKATIYNYFPSKEDLFFEVMSLSNEEEFQFVHEVIKNPAKNIDLTLYEFGERFLNFLYSPRLRDLRYLAIVESRRSNLGEITYERGTRRSQNIMAEYLNELMNNGKLKKVDSQIATKHLYSLLESELIYKFLFQINEEFSDEEIRNKTKNAVDVFIAAYVLNNN